MPLRVTIGHPTDPVRHRNKVFRLLGNLGTALIIAKTRREDLLLLLIIVGGAQVLIRVEVVLLLDDMTLMLLNPMLLLIMANILVIVGVGGGGGGGGALLGSATLILLLVTTLVMFRLRMTATLWLSYLKFMNSIVSLMTTFTRTFTAPFPLRLVPGDPPILTLSSAQRRAPSS